MLINNHRKSPQCHPRVSHAKKTSEKTDSVTLGWRENKTVRSLSADLMYVGGAAGAVGAGIYAADLFPSGMSGMNGVITGAVLGALSGGATGYGLGLASSAIWPTDRAGDAMLNGIMASAGGIIGGVSGALSGYFGAQPLLVAPAAMIGATAATSALAFARDKILHE